MNQDASPPVVVPVRDQPAPLEPTARRVLIVDDDEGMCDLIATSLGKHFDITCKTSVDEGLDALWAGDFDVIVTDLRMPRSSGLELCARVKERRPDVPVVVMTAFGNFETAVAAIRAGAYDFVVKPVEMDELHLLLDRVSAHRALEREVRLLRRAVSEGRSFGDLCGESAPMREVYDLIDRVSASESSVLITGESGTGKEVVARTLHERSKRAAGPFVAINCAAMPEQLLESELFGHARGAFTDARAPKSGLFVEANGGTLLLDEIGDMPLLLQPKLLRALQDRKVRPVGGTHEIPFDARILAATNRDLESMVEDQRFREDLFYRVNVIHIALPPLRARGPDVLLLAQRFLDHFAARAGKPVTGLTAEAARKLSDYPWPGNVRELANCVERAIALTRHDHLTLDDLPEKVRSYKPSHVTFPADDPRDIVPLEEVERRYILRVFEAAGHNRSLASQLLGVDRKTLYRKLEKYGTSGNKP